MATITPTIETIDPRSKLVSWIAITDADHGGPIHHDKLKPAYTRRTIQAMGTFGGGIYALEGSMDGVTRSGR